VKAIKDIVGLRIISIADGKQIGHIKDVVINAKKGSVDFIVVDQPSDYLGAKVIAYTDICGLGDFALTVPDVNVIQDVAQNADVQELLRQNVRVVGTKVLTKSGQLSGEVKELVIDEKTGKIAVCQAELANGERYDIDAARVITYGQDLLIVEDEQGLIPAPTKEQNEVAAVSSSAESVENPVNAPEAKEEETGFNLFEQRQLQYFVGKVVEKDVTLDNGEILKAGELITEETITKVKTRKTLMEITSYLRKQ